jgi:carbon monoxide dehydrogenase subunit G
MGPFRLSADLAVKVTAFRQPVSITFTAEGEDRQVSSRITVEAELTIEPREAGTVVAVNGRFEVTGRVATLGASMIRSKGEKILDQFFSSLEAELR